MIKSIRYLRTGSVMVVFILFYHLGMAHLPFFNILDYGAVNNDESFKNTEAIKKTIEAASLQGGGTVYFPSGIYQTGPIHLKSNITLHIDAGAEIRFSQDFDDYLPMVPTRFQGVNCTGFSPLIYGYQVKNVAITGDGTIDGQGEVWQLMIKNMRQKFRESGEQPLNKWQKIYMENNPNIADPDQFGFQRPLFIQFFQSENISIRDVTIQNSPFWTVHMVESNNIVIDGISVINPEHSSNTDGINPESSQNVRISNCYINVGDDCIAIKSGKGEKARKSYSPSKNISITNCTMVHGASGVAIGSEMSAGVENVTINNCVIDGTGKGIHIKTNRSRGGYVKNIRVNNVIFQNILRSYDKKSSAIYLNQMYYVKDSTEFMEVTDSTPFLSEIHFSDISISNVQYPILVYGLGEMPATNLTFRNVSIDSEHPVFCIHAKGVSFDDINLHTSEEKAFFCRNVKSLEIDGLKISSNSVDFKTIELINIVGGSINLLKQVAGNEQIIVGGALSKNIRILGKELLNKNSIQIADDVPPSEIQHY